MYVNSLKNLSRQKHTCLLLAGESDVAGIQTLEVTRSLLLDLPSSVNGLQGGDRLIIFSGDDRNDHEDRTTLMLGAQ